MSQIEIRLPKMGESVTEATITNWLKNIGDTVEMDEPLVEVATDKVDNELPSEAEGVLVERFFEEDQVAQEMANEQNYLGIGGSDAHIVSHIGRCATKFEDTIHNEQELVDALKAGRFEAIKLQQEAS